MSDMSKRVVQAENLDQFFSRELEDALQLQHVATSEATSRYIVGTLCKFARSERFFESHDGEAELKPLAMIYADAVHSRTLRQRQRALRRLGDVALFIAGVFSRSLRRKAVGRDYYMAMGGGAYAHLSACGISNRDVFGELSEKFELFVNALSELSIDAQFNQDGDLLEHYDAWLRTASARSHQRLVRAGIRPNWCLDRASRH